MKFRLKRFMKINYDTILTEYKVCTPKSNKLIYLIISEALFAIIVIGYLLRREGIIDNYYGPVIVVYSFFLLGLIPLSFFLKDISASIIISPKYIIKSYKNRDFIVIEFDNITDFLLSEDEEIIIEDKENRIVFEKGIDINDTAIIIDILEAKGKTFDKEKEHLIRPIEIEVKNKEILIVDLKVEETSTEKMVEKYYQEYPMLTPGFILDVIFMNSIVEQTYKTDNNLVIKLNEIQVKEGHPENTGFDPIIADDCIVIFEDVQVLKVFLKNTHDKSIPEESLPLELSSIYDNIEKGVIVNWKYRRSSIDLHFAIEIGLLKVSLKYKEVIIGWKSFK